MLDSLRNTVFAFRGYNVTNLGRTAELLQNPQYEPIVVAHLKDAGKVCQRVTGKPTDLLDRVRKGQETDLSTYAQAVALIVSVEIAQLEILKEVHGIDYRQARALMGYSLGELTAVSAAGVCDWRDSMALPLELAADCANLAENVTLAVVFSRQKEIPIDGVQQLCMEINEAGDGVIGISAILSPNSLLIMGQGTTVDRFIDVRKERFETPLIVRKNSQHYPPLHTPIMWQRAIADRVSDLMHTLKVEYTQTMPPVISLITGGIDYNEINQREMLRYWVDRPQRLWEAVECVLNSPATTVVHVGPEPNIIPATFQRLADNVDLQLKGNMGMRALAAAAKRPWLGNLLPQKASLLRAPQIEQVILEDWLLEHA